MHHIMDVAYMIFLVLCLDRDICVYCVKKEQDILPRSSYEKVELSEEDIPIILWWTSRLFSGDEKSLKKINCPKSTCMSTQNRRYLADTHTRGIFFYGTDLEPSDMPFPRHPTHEWALFHEESPMNNYMLVHGTTLSLFNHTATFRRESHFPLTTQHIPSLEYLMERKPSPVKEKNSLRQQGLAAVAYIQSHCDVASDRDRYVKELMKHIAVDSYGTCLNNKQFNDNLKDPVESMHTDEFLKVIGQYKFIISFENAICKDYMTEKLFRTMHVGSVPIYKGSVNAEDWMPDEKSVILIDDFETPKELAEYIIYLDKNDEEYMKYLNYKYSGISNNFLKYEIENRPWSTYGVIPHATADLPKPDMLNAFQCYICDEISTRVKHEKLMTNNPELLPLKQKIAKASHLQCPQPYTSLGDPNDLTVSDR